MNSTENKAIEQFDLAQLKEILYDMSVVAWDKRIERTHLERWLENFDGSILGDKSKEQVLAAWILLNFTFYTEMEVRALCREIFNEYLHSKLIEYDKQNILSDCDYSEKVKHIIDHTLFLPLGNPSESGTSILYYFRQENALSKKSFEIQSESKYENIVYIDDVTVTGMQAITYINKFPIDEAHEANKYILMFISSDEAVNCLSKEAPEFRLISAITLDHRSKCFSDSSFCFSGTNSCKLKAEARKLCEGYGKELFEEDPLGYGDGQYIFGFYYNTPDNTLPIIWRDSSKWKPAFQRYDKLYEKGAVEIDESKYL